MAKTLSDNGSILVRLEDHKYHDAVITGHFFLCLTGIYGLGESDIPVILYNVPSRTSVDLLPRTGVY